MTEPSAWHLAGLPAAVRRARAERPDLLTEDSDPATWPRWWRNAQPHATPERLGELASAAEAGNARPVSEWRARATLHLFCDCGRGLAFLFWPTRRRALAWCAAGRGANFYVWPDAIAPGVRVTCPHCTLSRDVTPADVAEALAAGPDAPRAERRPTKRPDPLDALAEALAAAMEGTDTPKD